MTDTIHLNQIGQIIVEMLENMPLDELDEFHDCLNQFWLERHKEAGINKLAKSVISTNEARLYQCRDFSS